MRKRGLPRSQAIQMAIGVIQRWARGGGDVDAGMRPAPSAPRHGWEAMKAKARARRIARAVAERQADPQLHHALRVAQAALREAERRRPTVAS